MPNVTAPPPDVGSMSTRELVEMAINNALPNIDDLPARSEYDITQSQLESELDAIAANAREIRSVFRGQPSAVSVSESVAAMDAVSASSTAMNAASASQTTRDVIYGSQLAFDAVAAKNMAIGKFVAGSAGLTPSNFADMDAVSASQAARDAVNASQAAFDIVSSLNMAIGKFVAGSAGLTPSNFADMDAVSASSTAMDAVSGSTIARTLAIGNQHAIDSLWSTTTGSETWLSAFQTQNDSSSQSLVAGPTSNGSAVEIKSGGNASTRGWTVDLKNYSTLKWKDRVPQSGSLYGSTYIRVEIDGDTVYSKRYGNSTQNSWETRTLDISTYSSQAVVVFRAQTNGDENITAQFGDIILS